MTRSAIECLRRAGLSTRANAGLIPLSLAQSFVFTLLVVASLVPPLMVLGGMALLEGEWDPATFDERLRGIDLSLADQLLPLALAVFASLVLGVLAVLVWGWFQGGMLGVLVAAERQAPPGAEGRPGAWQWFRTFSLRDFAGWGSRYTWRFFWFFHLSVTISLVLVLVAVLVAVGAGVGYEAWGGPAAWGIGCGAALPFLFALIVYALWNLTAQPAVALPESGVLRGAREGLRLVGRRPGAVLLVFVAFFVFSVVVWITVWMAQMVVGVAVPDDTLTWAVVYVLFSLVQWALGAVLTVYANAAYSSLVVAEAGAETGG